MSSVVDISIDLETFASRPDAALASIGACSTSGQEFYRVVHDPTGFWDPATVRWHAEVRTSDVALSTIGRVADAMPLARALREFSEWLRDHEADREGRARLWAHATFDFPILHLAYARAELPLPWFYRNARDLRTLYDLAGGRPERTTAKTHHALDDARAQLDEVRTCLARLDVARLPLVGDRAELRDGSLRLISAIQGSLHFTDGTVLAISSPEIAAILGLTRDVPPKRPRD